MSEEVHPRRYNSAYANESRQDLVSFKYVNPAGTSQNKLGDILEYAEMKGRHSVIK